MHSWIVPLLGALQMRPSFSTLRLPNCVSRWRVAHVCFPSDGLQYFSPGDVSAPIFDADANYRIRFLSSLRLLPNLSCIFSFLPVELFPAKSGQGLLVFSDSPFQFPPVPRVSTRCRIEKKEENRERTQTRRHPKDFPDWKGSKKLQRKKTISQPSKFITAHKLQKWKYKYKWKHRRQIFAR